MFHTRFSTGQDNAHELPQPLKTLYDKIWVAISCPKRGEATSSISTGIWCTR